MMVSVTDDQQKENIDPIHIQPRIHGNGFVLVLKPFSNKSDPSASSEDHLTPTNVNNTEGDSHSTDDEDSTEKHS